VTDADRLRQRLREHHACYEGAGLVQPLYDSDRALVEHSGRNTPQKLWERSVTLSSG
jgi:hypothetical protein